MNRRFRSWAALVGAWGLCLPAQPALAQNAILLAEDSKTPTVTVSWQDRDGKRIELKGPRRFQSAAQKTPLGKNIDCYVALGGTRLNKGIAHPNGAVVLVGLYKKDPAKPFFDAIADKSSFTISLSSVVMTHRADPQPKTAMMHLRYMLEDLKACGLSGNARNLFNTADPEDPILQRAAGGSVRPGCLDGKGEDHGKVETKVENDGSLTMTFTIPYALLRHIEDPYQRTNPGGFFEPNHFHIEMELLPSGPTGRKESETMPALPNVPKPDPERTPAAPAAPKPERPLAILTENLDRPMLGLCQVTSTRMRSARARFEGGEPG